MSGKKYIGGWKSIFYSMHVANEVGFSDFWTSLTSKNTCKTCAYGMGGQRGGMVNEAGDKIEICKKSMQAQLTDIQPAIPDAYFEKTSIAEIAQMRPREIERLGRLSTPLYKGKHDTHYKPMDWDVAISRIVEVSKATQPDRSFFYSSGRSSNEAAFLTHLFARLYGTNNVNNCSYYCHQASGEGLGSTLGTGTGTVDLIDVKNADVIFVIGANPASNHPRFVTELMHLRRRGGHVVVINPAKEPGLVSFSIPSDARSLLSTGSAIASCYLQPKVGGDMALIKGIAKYIITHDAVDQKWVSQYTEQYEDYKNDILNTSWETIEHHSGINRSYIEKAALIYMGGQNVIFAWAMGITHHIHGVQNVEAIANLAMLRGMLGRPNAGMMPLRGHSNVQGVGSVGVTPKLKSAIFKNIEANLNVKLPTSDGWDTMKCMNAAFNNEVDIAILLGGNLYGSNPDLSYAEMALDKVPFKVFISTTLNQGHLFGVKGECIILPAKVRDEESQPTTQESMFNFVRLSDGGPSRILGARSEVDIIIDIAEAIVPKTTFDFGPFRLFKNIREAIAITIPGFEDIADIDETKEEFHIGGRVVHEPIFNTASGKAIFKVNGIPQFDEKTSIYRLMTVRSEGQFNTIVYEEEDAWRGQKERWIVMMNPEDMKNDDIKTDQKVTIKSEVGTMTNVKVRPFDISRGSLMGYYPEMNILVKADLDPLSRTPSFKHTSVIIQK